MSDAVAVPASAQVVYNGTAKVIEIIKRLRANSLFLHGELIEERTAHARALLDSLRLQWVMKKVVKKKEETARLMTAGQASCKIARQWSGSRRTP